MTVLKHIRNLRKVIVGTMTIFIDADAIESRFRSKFKGLDFELDRTSLNQTPVLIASKILSRMHRSEQLWNLKFAETFLEASHNFGRCSPNCADSKVWLA